MRRLYFGCGLKWAGLLLDGDVAILSSTAHGMAGLFPPCHACQSPESSSGPKMADRPKLEDTMVRKIFEVTITWTCKTGEPGIITRTIRGEKISREFAEYAAGWVRAAKGVEPIVIITPLIIQ